MNPLQRLSTEGMHSVPSATAREQCTQQTTSLRDRQGIRSTMRPPPVTASKGLLLPLSLRLRLSISPYKECKTRRSPCHQKQQRSRTLCHPTFSSLKWARQHG